MNIGDKVMIPTIQSIGCCNATRCNAVVYARMYYQDFLTIVGIRKDERGAIVTVAAKDGNNYAQSDFMLWDLTRYSC